MKVRERKIVVFIVLVLFGGCSTMNQEITVSNQQLASLQVLRDVPKFLESESHFYPGAPSEELRLQLEGEVNALLEDLIHTTAPVSTKQKILARFEVLLQKVKNLDTEDRQEVGWYLEKIMDIYGIESSDGLLDRYLF